MTGRRRLTTALTTALAALLAAGGTSTPPDPGDPSTDSGQDVGAEVAFSTGAVRGAQADGVLEYRGIPDAEAPVGDLRWAAPEPAQPWDEVLDATVPGPRCPQGPGQVGAPAQTPASAEEDCLTLDVTVPGGAVPEGGYPVLVWLHGGGLRSGSAADDDTSALAAEGVAVVAVNYRLGALGFLSLPGLEGSGTFGLQDQQLALRWVADEIEQVGGDPDRVTIAGESGGADAVCAHLVSPSSWDLVDGAVLSSGTCSATNPVDVLLPGAGDAFATWKTRQVADGVGSTWAAASGCADPATTADCLRALPVEQVTAESGAYFSPVVGEGMLPQSPAEAIADGEVADVPVMIGTTRDEGTLFAVGFSGAFDETALAGLMTTAAGDRTPEALAAYPRTDRSPARAWADVVTDRGYACPNLASWQALTDSGLVVHAFEFAVEDAPSPFAALPPDLAGGATHGSDVPFVLDLRGVDVGLTARQDELAATMRAAWAAFAATGDPSTDDVPWPAVADGEALSLQAPTPEAVDLDQLADAHRCGLWE